MVQNTSQKTVQKSAIKNSEKALSKKIELVSILICKDFSQKILLKNHLLFESKIPATRAINPKNIWEESPLGNKISHLIPKTPLEGIQVQYLFSDGTILPYRNIIFHEYQKYILDILTINQTNLSKAEHHRNQGYFYQGEEFEIALIQKALEGLGKKSKVTWHLCSQKDYLEQRSTLQIKRLLFSEEEHDLDFSIQVLASEKSHSATSHQNIWQEGLREFSLQITSQNQPHHWDILDTHLLLDSKSKTLCFFKKSTKLNSIQKIIEDNIPYNPQNPQLWSGFSEGSVLISGHKNIDRLLKKLQGKVSITSSEEEKSGPIFFEGLESNDVQYRIDLKKNKEIILTAQTDLTHVTLFNKKIENCLKGFEEGLSHFFGDIKHGISKTKKRKYELLFFSHRGYYGYVVYEFLKNFLSPSPLLPSEFHKKISSDLATLIDAKINPGRFLRQLSPTGKDSSKTLLKEICNETITSFFERFIQTLYNTFEATEATVYLKDKTAIILCQYLWAQLIFQILDKQVIKTKAACFEKKTTGMISVDWTQSLPETLTAELSGSKADQKLEWQDLENLHGLKLEDFSLEELYLILFKVQKLTPHTTLYFEGEPLEALDNENFKAEFSLQSSQTAESRDVNNSTLDLNWFELHPKFFLNGEEIPEDLVRGMSEKGVLRWKGKLYLVQDNKLPSIQYLEKFWDKLRAGKEKEKTRRTISDSIYPLQKSQTLELLWLRSQGVPIDGNSEWKKTCDFYDSLSQQPALTELPNSMTASLKHYQHVGVQWLLDIYHLGLGGILADDMGLGKTLQSLAFFDILRNQSELKHVLIIVPTSLTYNWLSECHRFTPQIPVHIFSSKNKSEASLFLEKNPQGLIICSYGLFVEHADYFKSIRWNIQLYDEAQNLKNITAARTNACREIPSRFKLCLTGTPLENHLGEFYSLMDLVVPGVLGTYEEFRKVFVNPISIPYENILKLRQKTKPLILRRNKSEILKELPEKTESAVELIFEERQRKIYRDIAMSWNDRVKESIEKYGEAKSQIMMLTALLRLRQTCSDPASLPNTKYEAIPPKISTLLDSLQEITESGESALVFTQFLSTYDRILKLLTQKKIPVFSLNGTTTREMRQKNLKSFDDCPEGAVMLMTLKSGGVGLNLTKASYVFHIEPWWNPAVENQASDRAHRLGQTRKVQIFRYLMKDSVEEKIEILKDRKKSRFEAMFGSSKHSNFDFETTKDLETTSSKLTREDFDYLIQPS